MSFRFNLGDEVKTKITKYKGIIRARADHLTGCNTYGVQNEKLDKDGSPQKWQWFDEDELILVTSKKVRIIEEHEESEITKKASKIITKKDRGGPLSEDKIPKR